MKIILIFSCSGMFRNVPCSGFYRRPSGNACQPLIMHIMRSQNARKILFSSHGKVGREFIDKMTEHKTIGTTDQKCSPLLLKQRLHFLQPVYTSLARSQRLRITKSVWLSDWYCGKRVKLTNYCAKDGFLSNSRLVNPPNAARVFANLVMSGQINSALLYLSENDGGVLPLIDDVMAQLREKHPNPQEARLVPLLFGPVKGVPNSIYQQINGEIVRYATLRTKGSGGPSGVDANGFR